MDFCDIYEELSDLNHFYITENIPTSETKEMFEEYFAVGCGCEKICDSEQCNCQKSGLNYKSSESESDLTLINKADIIYECNVNCRCDKLCGNRLVQYGPNKYLIIKDTLKGKGLFANKKIIVGKFICEYAGEIITKTEALTRYKNNEINQKMNYILCVNEYFGENLQTTIIDPTYYGNIGRYINHSCDPNCKIVPIRINNIVPKLCIFAIKDIDVDEEITFDYGERFNDEKNKKLTPCLCNAHNCKGWMPYTDFK